MGVSNTTPLDTGSDTINRFKAINKLSKIAGHLRDGYPIHLLAPGQSKYHDKKYLAKRAVFGAGSLD